MRPSHQGLSMLTAIIEHSGDKFAHNPAERGYVLLYRPDHANFCPGCGRSHWYVGRFSAECGFCATALPIGQSAQRLEFGQ
jgi:hypothetical protein